MKLSTVLVALLLCGNLMGSVLRLTRPITLDGRQAYATFFSKGFDGPSNSANDQAFLMLANIIDSARVANYVSREDLSQAQICELESRLFSQEPLYWHDEVLVLHRRALGPPKGRLGALPQFMIGDELLALMAIDRLGPPRDHNLLWSFVHQGYSIEEAPEVFAEEHEYLLLEHRLQELGLKVPRPVPHRLKGNRLPPGVFPHWEPILAKKYFRPENVMVGDVVQVNALFTEKDWDRLLPILHLLANSHGLFSTGRIIFEGETAVVHGRKYAGPKVFIPTLFVWEVFNPIKDGERKEGTRTRYYKLADGRPLKMGEHDEWKDPLLGKYNVQIMSMTGDQLRIDWTKKLFAQDGVEAVERIVLGPNILQLRSVCGRAWNSLKLGDSESAHIPTSLVEPLQTLLALP